LFTTLFPLINFFIQTSNHVNLLLGKNDLHTQTSSWSQGCAPKFSRGASNAMTHSPSWSCLALPQDFFFGEGFNIVPLVVYS